MTRSKWVSKYRLVVGEQGNEQGHIIKANAQSVKGARIALGREVAKYGGHGWGHIEHQHDNGMWERLTDGSIINKKGGC